MYNMTAISNDISIFIPVGSFTLEDLYYIYLQYVDKIPVAGGIKEDILDDNPYHLSLDTIPEHLGHYKESPLGNIHFRDGFL